MRVLVFTCLISIFLVTNCKKEEDHNPIEPAEAVDIDNNVYEIITIGSQTWMKENLRVTKYSNGDVIGTTTNPNLVIAGHSRPKYQWPYDGIESNALKYGRLYTYYVIIDPRNICPRGWHIPTDAEWTTLTQYLINNGYGYQYDNQFYKEGIAKSMASPEGWNVSNAGGAIGNIQLINNRSGFSALPGGFRDPFGDFNDIKKFAYWWSSTEAIPGHAHSRDLWYNSSSVIRYYYRMDFGFSVRCIKD